MTGLQSCKVSYVCTGVESHTYRYDAVEMYRSGMHFPSQCVHLTFLQEKLKTLAANENGISIQLRDPEFVPACEGGFHH